MSGGVSSELRSAAVKMLFVKEENTSEPETWRIKHEESETCRIKQEESETCRIKQEEPETWRIKQEEQGGWCLSFIFNDCLWYIHKSNVKP